MAFLNRQAKLFVELSFTGEFTGEFTGPRVRPLAVLLVALLLCLSSSAKAQTWRQAERICQTVPQFEAPICWFDSAPPDSARPMLSAKPVMILIHGIGAGGSADWKGLWPQLSSQFRLLAPDLPGYGFSEASPNDALTPSRYAAAIDHLSRDIDAPLMVVGHSMGGVVALRFALDYPRRVSQLVLIDVAGVQHRFAFAKQLVGSFTGEPGEEWQSRGVVSRIFSKVFELFEGTPRQWRQAGEERLLKQFADVRQASAYHTANEDFSGQLSRIFQPTLIVWGELDRITPLRTARLLHQQIPQARLKIIPQTGHSPLFQRPSQLSRLLLDNYHQRPIAELEQRRSIPPVLSSARPEGEKQSTLKSPPDGRCERGVGGPFEGHYRRLDIRHCDQLVLDGVTVEQLQLFESRVVIRNSRIGTELAPIALSATGSELYLDNSWVEAQLPIMLSGSRLDIAGVTLNSHTGVAIKTQRGSNLVASLSRFIDPEGTRQMHGFWHLSASQ